MDKNMCRHFSLQCQISLATLEFDVCDVTGRKVLFSSTDTSHRVNFGIFIKKLKKFYTIKMSTTSKTGDQSCTLCQRIGLRPLTKENILYYYAPLNGMVSLH